VDGKAMLLRAVDAALGSAADPVIVVTGHEADRVTALVGDRAVRVIHNAAFAEGIASSIRRGIAAVPDDCDGAVILLGDMPAITSDHVDRLIAAFRPQAGHGIILPVVGTRRGNPVLWARRYFKDLMALSGDVGGRRLFERFADAVCTVDMDDDPAALHDVDTPDMLAGKGPTGAN